MSITLAAPFPSTDWIRVLLLQSTSETSICSTALGQSICVISTWYLLTQDVASVAFPYLEYAFPVLSIPTVQNSSGCNLCLSPILSSIQTGVGGLAGFRRALEGVSNSGVFIGIPFTSVTWRYVECDWLKVNISVTYVTLVPWRRERRRNVPSPQLLYHRCTAGAHSLGSSAKKLMWVCTCSPFIPVLRGEVHVAKHIAIITLETSFPCS